MADVGIRVLPWSPGRDGARPVDHAAQQHHRPGERRRAHLELRPVRLAGTDARLRLERLRRDAARAVGVGRQATRGQRRDRRPQQRLHACRSADCHARVGPWLSRADGGLLRDGPARYLVRPDDRGRHRGIAARARKGQRPKGSREGGPGAPAAPLHQVPRQGSDEGRRLAHRGRGRPVAHRRRSAGRHPRRDPRWRRRPREDIQRLPGDAGREPP